MVLRWSYLAIIFPSWGDLDVVDVDISTVGKGQGDLLSLGTWSTFRGQSCGFSWHGYCSTRVRTNLDDGVTAVLWATLLFVGDLQLLESIAVLHVDCNNLALLDCLAVRQTITRVLAGVGNVTGAFDRALLWPQSVSLCLLIVQYSLALGVLNTGSCGLGQSLVSFFCQSFPWGYTQVLAARAFHWTALWPWSSQQR